jgi:hypothetical protein
VSAGVGALRELAALSRLKCREPPPLDADLLRREDVNGRHEAVASIAGDCLGREGSRRFGLCARALHRHGGAGFRHWGEVAVPELALRLVDGARAFRGRQRQTHGHRGRAWHHEVGIAAQDP